MDDSSEDDEESSAPQIDYGVKTLPLWMITVVKDDGYTSEDDEDEEATAGPTEVLSDYHAKTLPLWMINVDTDGCTCEDEENDEGARDAHGAQIIGQNSVFMDE
ncbi:unnamed protein product [Sphagnum balticum]